MVVRKSTNLDMFLDSPLDLDIVVGDITDTTFLQGAMEGCKTVFHIASKRMIQPLADAIQNTPSVKNVVMVSSTIVYSEHYRLVDSLADDEALPLDFDVEPDNPNIAENPPNTPPMPKPPP